MTDEGLRRGRRQKPRQRGPAGQIEGEAHDELRGDEPMRATDEPAHPRWDELMEEVVAPANLARAMKRVRQNRGSPGIDGMTCDELPDYLERNERFLREQLLSGVFEPQPVRRVTIPKSDGGERELGIPTVVDRLVQQAISQVLGPRFDAGFSSHSHGFRPGHSAHDAVYEAQRYIQEGCDWVVDVDLERFFDRVNHDVLMGKLAKKIADRRMLKILRGFLEAGMMMNGVVIDRDEGTQYLRGWKQYFGICEVPRPRRDLDVWIRARLRLLQVKQWKRGTTAYPRLVALGSPERAAIHTAQNLRRWWHAAHSPGMHLAMPISYFDQLGLPRLV